jgi:adenine-specific DNA-methyltransferase
VDYILFLKANVSDKINDYVSNEHMIQSFEEVLNACVYELYFEEHMKEVGIDVLSIINDELLIINAKYGNDINNLPLSINHFYEWYQKSENPVRERMLLVETRSKDIIAVINKSI